MLGNVDAPTQLPAVKKQNFGTSLTNIRPFLFCQGFSLFFVIKYSTIKMQKRNFKGKKGETITLRHSGANPEKWISLFFLDVF